MTHVGQHLKILTISKNKIKWHILSEKHRKLEETKVELTTKQLLPQLHHALTVELQHYTTEYVASVATTEANKPLKNKLLFNKQPKFNTQTKLTVIYTVSFFVLLH